ncbi:Enhancer of mRNA-decapping protein 3 [Papilio machaon]|uniref:Enhancer of mRNA-decapping protein 3 n=1 Tax=Papilio machaon TaxID=76193 RepID=A0A0N1IEX2_PAPMA|nr:Enhancer of mRNA-decapping protein 3 [Papilio machaon]
MSSWVGYAVSVNCGEPLGCYQGTIVETDGSTITLTKAFRNGFPYPKSKVTLNAVDIKELKIIEESQSAPPEQTHSTVSVTKSNKKGQRATVCENLQANPSNLVNIVSNSSGNNVSAVQTGAGRGPPPGPPPGPCRSKPIDIQGPRSNKNISHSGFELLSETYCELMMMRCVGAVGAACAGGYAAAGSVGAGGGASRGRGGAQEKARRRNEACFGDDAESAMHDDFDFEGNLALFDKQVPEELRACEYRTETGAAVPGVSDEVRRRLWAGLRGWAGGAGEAAGVLLARAAADVALQLVGGGRRLDWRNAHQAPVCVAVAGPHRTGAAAVLAARLLASHGARAYVLLAGNSPLLTWNIFMYISNFLKIRKSISLSFIVLYIDGDFLLCLVDFDSYLRGATRGLLHWRDVYIQDELLKFL